MPSPTRNLTGVRPEVSTATSRMAASGGTREARQAGTSEEITVTIRPVAMATTTELGRIASAPSGSWSTAPSRAARPRPTTKPMAEPTSPTTAASTTTARRTWRRRAPMARNRAISRVRCATTMANEL